MKNITLTISCLLLVSASAHAQISIGPAVGVNSTQYSFRSMGTKAPSGNDQMVFDFRFGAIANVPLSGNLHLQPAILYTTNSRYWQSPANSQVWGKFRLNAIDVPVNIAYKTQEKNGNHFFVAAGPFLAVNVNGTIEATGVDIAGNLIGSFKSDLVIGDKTPPAQFRRLGAGVNANIGYEWKGGFSSRLHFQKGLKNLYPAPFSDNARVTSLNYGITLAYQFRLKKNKKVAKEEKQ